MKCPTCGATMTASLELTGGCTGHPEGCYCYCDSPDVHVEFTCPATRNHGKDRCKQPVLRVSDLSDQYSIARWLTDHYNSSEITRVF